MLRKAKDYVYAAARDFFYSSKYGEAVIDCRRRVVRLHIMVMNKVDEKNYQRAKWYFERIS